VTVEPVVGCGKCRHCAAGDYQICPGMRVHGFMLPGGFAEYANVPARGLFPVANDVPAAVAALGEPLAVSIHGLDRGRFEPGQRVLVLGAGTVGLVTLVVARALGAGEVWVSARYPHQADLANDLGAKRVLREEEARAESLDVLGREQDFDLVVETVGGSAETVRDACAAVRPGGSVSVLGVFNRSPTLEPFRMLLKECTLSWSNCYCHPSKDTADFARAAALIDTEREVLDRITTHQLPLERVADAFALADDKKSGAVKVTLQP
jgi:threonine dehydrogenase-like Zn-dependent dehydrogenase